MIMKKFMMIVTLAVVTLTASAQHEVGSLTLQPKVGLTLANLTKFTDSKIKAGFQAGVELEYQFAPQMSIAGAAVYSDQGAKGDNGLKENLGYINIPIVFNYYVANGFAIKAGVQPAFLTSAKDKASGNSVDIKDACNKFDFSIPVGLSYEISNVVIDARYNFGLTKVYKGSDVIKSKNSVIQITLGYKFDL